MTAGALRQALRALPDAAPVVAYADWEGVAERPLELLEERLYICGYFTVKGAAIEDAPEAVRGVLLLGERTE